MFDRSAGPSKNSSGQIPSTIRLNSNELDLKGRIKFLETLLDQKTRQLESKGRDLDYPDKPQSQTTSKKVKFDRKSPYNCLSRSMAYKRLAEFMDVLYSWAGSTTGGEFCEDSAKLLLNHVAKRLGMDLSMSSDTEDDLLKTTNDIILSIMNSPKTRYPSDKFSQKKIREHRRRDSMNRELNAMKNLVISKSNGKNDGKKLEPAMILEAFTELYMNTKDEIEKVKKENAELESELGYQPYQPEISPKNTAEFSEINNTPTTTPSGSNDTASSSSAGDESALQASQIFSATEEASNLPIPPLNMPMDPFQPMNLMTQPTFFPILPPQPMVQPNFPLLYQFQALQQQMALQNMMSGHALTFQTMPQPTTSQEQLNLLLLQNMLQNSLSQQNICNNE